MTYKVSLDDLTGTREVLMEVEIQGKTYEVTSLRHIPESRSLRIMQGSANYEAVKLEVSRAIEILDTSSKGAYDSNGRVVDPAKLSEVNSQRIAQEMRLVTPLRQILEAVIGVDDGVLAQYSPGVLQELFTEVYERVLKPQSTEVIPEPEPIAEPLVEAVEPEPVVEAVESKPAKRAKAAVVESAEPAEATSAPKTEGVALLT